MKMLQIQNHSKLGFVAMALMIATLALSGCTQSSAQKAGDAKQPEKAEGKAMNVTSEVVEYTQGETTLEGYVARPKGDEKHPGILVVHNWMGLTDLTKQRCDALAEKGYVAFAADIYGKGVRPADAGEAGKQAGKYRADRALLRARAQAALDELKGMKQCDASKVVAIGFCFGGGTVLELARSGADVQGVVSFHGNLDTPNTEDAEQIKCKVLVQHGAEDFYVNMEAVTTFEQEMTAAQVDFQVVLYGGAVHSFTNPNAGDDKKSGSAYHKRTADRAWKLAYSFFEECCADK